MPGFWYEGKAAAAHARAAALRRRWPAGSAPDRIQLHGVRLSCRNRSPTRSIVLRQLVRTVCRGGFFGALRLCQQPGDCRNPYQFSRVDSDHAPQGLDR